MPTQIVKMRAIALEPPAMSRTLFAGSSYELDTSVVAQLKAQGVLQTDLHIALAPSGASAVGDGVAQLTFTATVTKAGNPAASVPVLFATDSPTVQLSATSGTTDAAGIVTVTATENLTGAAEADDFYFVASAEGAFAAVPATFTVPPVTPPAAMAAPASEPAPAPAPVSDGYEA